MIFHIVSVKGFLAKREFDRHLEVPRRKEPSFHQRLNRCDAAKDPRNL